MESPAGRKDLPVLDTVSAQRRILWKNVTTVLGAAILIGAEVFGAGFAGGWAIANLLGLGDYGVYGFQALLMGLGAIVMVQFVRHGMRIEPFTRRG
ncbi:hypothetical protein [Rhodoplanes serenus]|uniref:hypothetical protein n=1 Tax=Rhodoplanes serenus TaxID=200615 RepID=UPI000DAEFE53|nr:hypothetical protein CH340_19385 [Rhodoplanes serenus]